MVTVRAGLGIVVVLMATGVAVHAEDYRLPPREVVAIVDAAPAPDVSLRLHWQP